MPGTSGLPLEGTGIAEVREVVERHREHLESTGLLDERRREQMLAWLRSLLQEAVLAAVDGRPGVADALTAARADVLAGAVTVPQAVARVMDVAGLITS